MLLVPRLQAAEPEYLRDITRWQDVLVPSKSNQGDWMVWSYAANYSKHEWRVFSEDGEPRAQLSNEIPKQPTEHPAFSPKAGRFRDASAFVAVDDGWLVGFNQGEFGAALYWFSRDGKSRYKISDHQVVDFFRLPDGVHAIEGLAHMTSSRGSVIRIARPQDNKHWQATSIAKLPLAPCAVSVRRDATMLITLSDSLVLIGPDHKIRTLLPDAPWGYSLPGSSVLSPNEQKLYIGMRQFVGELDLPTAKLRLLVPSDQFLNKLSKQDEERIRKQYRD